GSPCTVISTSLGLTLKSRTSAVEETTSTGRLKNGRWTMVVVNGTAGVPSFWMAKETVIHVSTANDREKSLSQKSFRKSWRRKAIIWKWRRWTARKPGRAHPLSQGPPAPASGDG